MEYALSAAQADEVLRALSRDFTVCAPKRFPKAGRYSDTDIVRYDRVEKFSDIVWETKSDYPAKEAVSPIPEPGEIRHDGMRRRGRHLLLRLHGDQPD